MERRSAPRSARLASSSVFSDEPEFVSVRITDRELARTVGRVEERLDHVSAVTKLRPPSIYITDAEVVSARSGDGFHFGESNWVEPVWK